MAFGVVDFPGEASPRRDVRHAEPPLGCGLRRNHHRKPVQVAVVCSCNWIARHASLSGGYRVRRFGDDADVQRGQGDVVVAVVEIDVQDAARMPRRSPDPRAFAFVERAGADGLVVGGRRGAASCAGLGGRGCEENTREQAAKCTDRVFHGHGSYAWLRIRTIPASPSGRLHRSNGRG